MYEGYKDLTYKNIYKRHTIVNFEGIRNLQMSTYTEITKTEKKILLL